MLALKDLLNPNIWMSEHKDLFPQVNTGKYFQCQQKGLKMLSNLLQSQHAGCFVYGVSQHSCFIFEQSHPWNHTISEQRNLLQNQCFCFLKQTEARSHFYIRPKKKLVWLPFPDRPKLLKNPGRVFFFFFFFF